MAGINFAQLGKKSSSAGYSTNPVSTVQSMESLGKVGNTYYWRVKKGDGGYDYYKGEQYGNPNAFKLSQADATREINAGASAPAVTSTPTSNYSAALAEAQAASAYTKYLMEQEQKKQAALNMLSEYLNSYDSSNPFVSGVFDEAAANARSEAEFNPFYEDKIKRLKDWNDLSRRDATEDWTRTADTLKAKKETEGFTYDTGEKTLFNNLADSNIARSGVGLRQWALGKVQNTFNNEGIARDITANDQIKNLNLDKINTQESNDITDLNRQKTTDIANRNMWEQQQWQSAEDKRYADWQSSKNDRIAAYKRSLGLT